MRKYLDRWTMIEYAGISRSLSLSHDLSISLSLYVLAFWSQLGVTLAHFNAFGLPKIRKVATFRI